MRLAGWKHLWGAMCVQLCMYGYVFMCKAICFTVYQYKAVDLYSCKSLTTAMYVVLSVCIAICMWPYVHMLCPEKAASVCLCHCVHCIYVAVSTCTVWEHCVYFWVLSACTTLYYGCIDLYI